MTTAQQPKDDGWGLVIAFILAGFILLYFLLTACSSTHYIDSFEGADTVWQNTTGLYEVDC